MSSRKINELAIEYRKYKINAYKKWDLDVKRSQELYDQTLAEMKLRGISFIAPFSMPPLKCSFEDFLSNYEVEDE